MPPFDVSPASPLKLFLEFKGRIINISDICWANFKLVGAEGTPTVAVVAEVYLKGEPTPFRFAGIDAEIVRRHLKRFAAETPTPPAEWVEQYNRIVAESNAAESKSDRRPDDGTHGPRDEGSDHPPIGPPW
jgi:hypothetical protein